MIFYFQYYFVTDFMREATKAETELLALEEKTKSEDACKDEHAFKAAS